MTAFKTHAELLGELIVRLETEELPFYETQASRSYLAWHAFTIVSLALSAVTAITAELIDGKQFDQFGKELLTLLPLVSTVVAALASHFRFHEKEALREAGRIGIVDLIADARGLAAAAKADQDWIAAYNEIRKRSYQLELKQHFRDVALRSKEQKESGEQI